MKFRSKKGFLMISVVIVVSTLMLYLLFSALNNTNKDLDIWIPSIVLILAVPLFLLWILVHTYYVLENGELKYVSGPIRGSIKIADIRQVTKNTTLWVGLKPATARNGIIISSKNYSELYISPVNNNKFIESLLEINSQIKVVDHKNDPIP
ncbi:PH domain-containing protein [Nonlabens marinus]|uniref:CDS_ID OB0931 n=1 Tax=Nonlabens marinus S1-08 TaxID=1454201 RepID=W8VXE2_9FLAO|nr:PH domain-containing protein [Nonlabens marinus]BAO55772.1 CDS_ID OB0931 [Nonlabens marinus S1-08]